MECRWTGRCSVAYLHIERLSEHFDSFRNLKVLYITNWMFAFGVQFHSFWKIRYITFAACSTKRLSTLSFREHFFSPISKLYTWWRFSQNLFSTENARPWRHLWSTFQTLCIFLSHYVSTTWCTESFRWFDDDICNNWEDNNK